MLINYRSGKKKIELIGEGVDYKLKEKRKTSIMKYCQNDVYSDSLACLGKYLVKPDVDTECIKIIDIKIFN